MGIFYTWNYIIHCFLYLTSIYHDVFKVYPCCSMNQFIIPFDGRIIFHYMKDLSTFLYSLADRLLSSFYFLCIMNNASMNICIKVSVWAYVFSSLGHIPRSGLVGLIATLFTFWGSAKQFFKATRPSYITTSNVWGFQFLQILTNIDYFLFRCSHPSEGEVVSHSRLDLRFPSD